MRTALKLLGSVPAWAWVILALLTALGVQEMRVRDARAEIAQAHADTEKVRREFGEYRETQERNARQALETQARNAAHTARMRQEAADAEHLARKAAEADAARLRAGNGQLQRYAQDLATSLGDRARDTSAAGSCQAAEGRIRWLAYVVGALDDFAAEAAAEADARGRAGLLCQRTYDALKPGD
jgi:hypothetical protein